MSLKQRVEKDLKKFDKLLVDFEKEFSKIEYKKVVSLAKNYHQDARHFYKTGDLETAFAATNYAHGLLDAIRIIEKKF